MLIFRGPLIRDLVARGVRVTAVCPPGCDTRAAQLRALGADVVPVRGMRRSGINPVADAGLLVELARLLKRLQPTHVFAYFIKPSIYGILAARFAGVPYRTCLIEGAGYAFAPFGEDGPSIKRRLARISVSTLLRASLPFADHLFVLNRDDEDRFLRGRYVRRERLSRLDGIGVDLEVFTAAAPVVEPITFTFAGRLIAEKGVERFVAAARLLRARFANLRFLILGGLDDNPSALSAAQLQAWVDEGVVEWPGRVDDIRPWLARTSVFVLPSLYPEGLPRTIMEAMACGRPVVTSRNVAGCRDSIADGASGYTVDLNEPTALVDAMARFIEHPELVTRMGRHARREAEYRYDVRDANRRFIEILDSNARGHVPISSLDDQTAA